MKKAREKRLAREGFKNEEKKRKKESYQRKYKR